MNVSLYTASWKSLERRKVKDLLERNGIDYREYDLTHDKDALENLMKKTSLLHSLKCLPVIEIGNDIIHGFNPRKILAALKRNGLV